MPNLECDFCNVFIENDGEGSAFCNGSAFSNVELMTELLVRFVSYLNEENVMPNSTNEVYISFEDRETTKFLEFVKGKDN